MFLSVYNPELEFPPGFQVTYIKINCLAIYMSIGDEFVGTIALSIVVIIVSQVLLLVLIAIELRVNKKLYVHLRSDRTAYNELVTKAKASNYWQSKLVKPWIKPRQRLAIKLGGGDGKWLLDPEWQVLSVGGFTGPKFLTVKFTGDQNVGNYEKGMRIRLILSHVITTSAFMIIGFSIIRTAISFLSLMIADLNARG